MSARSHVWIDEPFLDNGVHTISAVIEAPNRRSEKIFFRIPEQWAAQLSSRADAFAAISIFTLMKIGADAIIHGEVSPSLIRNLEEFQAAWSSWFPNRYRLVELTADVERERVRTAENSGTCMAFSGGVDAAFSAYRHHQGGCGRRSRPIEAAVMIHGYDIPAADDAMFAHAFSRARAMTDSLGIDLLPVTTNYRLVEPLWEDVHLACVAACLMLFEGKYDAAVVGSSEPYASLVIPWASNPVSDHLLGSDGFRILHDGAECNRLEKLAYLSSWEEGMENLLVCWEPTPDGKNCCRCIKCIRTILNFRVMGLDRPRCFPHDVSDRQIFSMRNMNDTMVNDFNIIVDRARASGIDHSWVGALSRVVQKYRYRKSIGRLPLARFVKSKLKATAVFQ